MFDWYFYFWWYIDGQYGEYSIIDSTNWKTLNANQSSYFDVLVDLAPKKKVILRKLLDFVTVLDEIGGFSESMFGFVSLVFSAYAITNFKLEFVKQAFKKRLNDAAYDPAVYQKGVIIDNKIIETLKPYVEPTTMKKTCKMYILDIFEASIAFVKVIINSIVCHRKNLRVKWE